MDEAFGVLAFILLKEEDEPVPAVAPEEDEEAADATEFAEEFDGAGGGRAKGGLPRPANPSDPNMQSKLAGREGYKRTTARRSE